MSVQQVLHIPYRVLRDTIVQRPHKPRVHLENFHRQQRPRRQAHAVAVPRLGHILYRHLHRIQHVQHAPWAITALQGVHQPRVLLERILLLDRLLHQRV